MVRPTGVAVVALLAASFAAGPAIGRPLPPPAGELTLDIVDPIVTVMIAGVALRLRVDLDQRDVVELNRAAVARLPLAFAPGPTDAVGREDAPSVVAAATFTMNDRPVAVTLASHSDCCAGVDGAIGAAMLPYALVRFVRAGAGAGEPRTFAMTSDEGHGLTTAETIGRETLRVGFSLTRPETLATAAAGAILAQARGGRFEGGYASTPIAFGIARPTRPIALARPALLAGFRFDRIVTRTADYGGRRVLPRDAQEAGAIALQPATRLLTLRCDFAG